MMWGGRSVLICNAGPEKAGWLRELLSTGFHARAASAENETLDLLAGRAVDVAVLVGDPADPQQALLRSSVRNALRILVAPALSARAMLAMTNEADLILPAPVEPEVLVTAVELVLTKADYVGRFARAHRMSPRETSLVRFALAGMNNDEAAVAMGCSRATVSSFWNRIFRKTGAAGQRDVFILLLKLQRGQSPAPNWSADREDGAISHILHGQPFLKDAFVRADR